MSTHKRFGVPRRGCSGVGDLRLWLLVGLLLLAGCAGSRPGATTSGSGSETAPWYVEVDAPASAQPLLLLDQGYGQKDRSVDFGFTVRNPNTSVQLRDSEYTVVAYAEDGALLGSTSGWISRVAPGATWGVGGHLRLETAGPVSRIEVEVAMGTAAPDFPAPAFVVEGVRIFRAETVVRATGVLHNPYLLGVTGVPVSAIFYDEEDGVVAGAATYAGYLPGQGYAGIDVSAAAAPAEVARVIFYASAGVGTQRHDPAEWPAGAAAPVLADHGFGLQGRSLIWAGIVTNPSREQAIRDWRAVLTAYNAEGTVLATRRVWGWWLLGGQELAVVESLLLPEGEHAVRVEVEMVPLRFVPSAEAANLPGFTMTEVTLENSSRTPRAHGRIATTTGRDIAGVKVVAILYDAADRIVGGGTTYADLVPAEGQAEVSVYVRGATAEAVRADMSATVTVLSE